MHDERNNYQYYDHDYIYTDPKTGILKNIQNISDKETLVFVETGATDIRARELKDKPIGIVNAYTLLDIHHHLFQDVYKWAGQRKARLQTTGKPL
jgi:cell filamentation protein